MEKNVKLFDNNELATYLSMYHFQSVCGTGGFIATFIDGYNVPLLLHMYNKDGCNMLKIEGRGGLNNKNLLMTLTDYFANNSEDYYYMLYSNCSKDDDGYIRLWFQLCKGGEEEG